MLLNQRPSFESHWLIAFAVFISASWNSSLGFLWHSPGLPVFLLTAPSQFLQVLSLFVFEVLQSSLLGPKYLHIIFWWSHPIDWLEIPTKCWWLSQLLISCLTSSWLMFPLYFLVFPPRYLIGIWNFVWLKQNSVLFFKNLLAELFFILYELCCLVYVFLSTHFAYIQTISKLFWLYL